LCRGVETPGKVALLTKSLRSQKNSANPRVNPVAKSLNPCKYVIIHLFQKFCAATMIAAVRYI
jgi:hypothetical protein